MAKHASHLTIDCFAFLFDHSLSFCRVWLPSKELFIKQRQVIPRATKTNAQTERQVLLVMLGWVRWQNTIKFELTNIVAQKYLLIK